LAILFESFCSDCFDSGRGNFFYNEEIIFNGELGMVGQFGIKKSVPLKFGINLVSIFGLLMNNPS